MTTPPPGGAEDADRHPTGVTTDTGRDALLALVRATQQEVRTLLVGLTGSTSVEGLARETYRRALDTAPFPCPDENGRLVVLRLALATAEQSGAFGLRLVPAGDGSPHALVTTLPRDLRLAFVLTQTLRLTYARAGKVCDVPASEIRTRVARARERLLALTDTRWAHRDPGTGPARPS